MTIARMLFAAMVALVAGIAVENAKAKTSCGVLDQANSCSMVLAEKAMPGTSN